MEGKTRVNPTLCMTTVSSTIRMTCLVDLGSFFCIFALAYVIDGSSSPLTMTKSSSPLIVGIRGALSSAGGL